MEVGKKIPNYLVLEAVRHLEEAGAHLPPWYPGDETTDLEQLLSRRARFLMVPPLQSALASSRRFFYGIAGAITLLIMLIVAGST